MVRVWWWIGCSVHAQRLISSNTAPSGAVVPFSVSPALRKPISPELWYTPNRTVLVDVWWQHFPQWFGFHLYWGSLLILLAKYWHWGLQATQICLETSIFITSWAALLEKALMFLVRAQWQGHKKFLIIRQSCICLAYHQLCSASGGG